VDETKLGRPSKYLPEYDDMLIKHMSEGMSFESFAGLVGVCKQTIYTWCDIYPTFLDSKKVGVEKGRYFHERLGIAAMAGKIENFNSTVWVFSMKNRFGWRDKKDINVGAVQPTLIKRLNGEVVELGMSGQEERERDQIEET
jgi:hypothetical protein